MVSVDEIVDRLGGPEEAARLTGVGLFAFAVSHLLGLVIGAWPSVFTVSAATAAACWRLSDSRRRVASPAG